MPQWQRVALGGRYWRILCCPRKLAVSQAVAHAASLLRMCPLYPLTLLANGSVFKAHAGGPSPLTDPLSEDLLGTQGGLGT